MSGVGTLQPMLELLSYLRAKGRKTYIATSDSQDFVKAGMPFPMKDPKLLLNDDK